MYCMSNSIATAGECESEIAQFGETGEIFAYYVKLEVDACAGLNCAEISVLECVGDNGHTEGAGSAVAYGEAHAVYREPFSTVI